MLGGKLMKSDRMNELYTECADCRGCRLCETRTNLVFGRGDPESEVMLIGEGPGEQEDLSGTPFVGRAGQLLDDMLKMIDLTDKKVYIANVVKCRPPKNRDPLPQEKEACRHWLDRQIEIVEPKIIICLGRIAGTSMIREDFRITKERGRWFTVNGVQTMAIYHPAALLRDPTKRPDTFTDLREIRSEIKRLCKNTY